MSDATAAAEAIPRPVEQGERTRSGRLALWKPVPGDADELFQMYSDPRLSEADPLIGHTSMAHTVTVLQRWIDQWHEHGHGLWVLRTLDGATAGEFVGIGGCNLRADTAWNLSFSLRPQSWGRGYAQEVAAAGMESARALRPDLPITAVVATLNLRSQRAVERAGLHKVWQGPDNHHPDPTATMLLYADRALSNERTNALTR
jgi:ribosomal-protein-alanine N-acetyltransferase